VIIKKAQIATKVRVKGEARPRHRTDDQIANTVKHEKELHKEIGRTFDKDNQKRAFPGVYSSADKAERAAREQLKKEWNEAQKHDKRFEDVIKKEAFR